MIVDLFLVYQFVKRLATPFVEWDAYKLGIIDEDGNQLKKRKDFRLRTEKEAFGTFDIMVMKLKRLLEKIPGGKSRIGSYAAALYLIKENEEIRGYSDDMLTEEFLEDKLLSYIDIVEDMHSEGVLEDAPANSASSGNIAGIGVGPDGAPGVSKETQKRLQKKKKSNIVRKILHKVDN